MTEDKHYGGIDTFKVIAALLVICIHTSPLSSISSDADFLLTRIIARIAVPYFLMVTGCFVLPQYLFGKSYDTGTLLRVVKKILILYVVSTLIYLPINIYAGHFKGLGVLDFLRLVIFDGTFYHLWYLPGAILGIFLVYLLGRKLPYKAVLGITLLLYCIGLLGDSYYGAISEVPILSTAYGVGFKIFSYTRNGLFYVPIFLVMGAWFGHTSKLHTTSVNVIGFTLSMVMMGVEGFVLHNLGWQRHDSMYIALLPCMYFLYQLALSWNRKPKISYGKVLTWVYLIHPFCIVVVRGIARVTGLVGVLVENSLIHYFAVTVLSIILSIIIDRLPIFKGKKQFCKGRAWIELDRSALRHNVDALNNLLPDGCELMPAVKANAYGHGAILISRELNKMGVKAFCVASVLEGVELRRNGIMGEILILGYTHPEEFHYLHRYRLTQTVIDSGYAEIINEYGKKIKVHIGIDTGMHRLGERSENIDKINRIFQCKNLKIDGIFTHLCVSDDTNHESKDYTFSQAGAFYEVISQIHKLGYKCPKKHIISSYGLLNYPELAENYVRIGIALYGMLSTRPDTENSAVSLKPVLSIKARVAEVKDLFRGEAAGYGLEFAASQDTRIAVVTIGYGDGIPRSLSCGVGKVLINGREAPIVGRICMDQMLVDVSGILDVNTGDTAVIVGRSEDAEITVCDLAEQTGTIANEILSRLGSRLERQML